jgi:hypothetical protein
MNRQQRRTRASRKRKFEVGTVIRTESFRVNGLYYWFETPEGWTQADGLPDVEFHGPFKTDAECAENERLVLLGPQCSVTDGGTVTADQLFALAVKQSMSVH